MPHNDGADPVTDSIREMIAGLSASPSDCCILRVHKQLREVNDKAYDPEIVAIGPYHRDKKNLQMMEEHKLRYLQLLLQQKHECDARKYVSAIRSLEVEARQFYAEPTDEIIKMMVLDGCFIIELLRKFEMVRLRDENDPIFKMDWIVNSLQRDLMLFENQLPFSILRKLFDIIEAPNNHNRLIYIALSFFHDLVPGPGCRERIDENSNLNIRHLLGLIHYWPPLDAVVVPNNEDAQNRSGNQGFIPNTTELQEVGVEVENVEATSSLIGNEGDGSNTQGNWRFIPNITKLREAGVEVELKKIEVEGSNLFDIKFKRGVLQIPPLTIEDRTESFFRNLIAYEQYCPANQLSCYVTDYVKFMDCLIDSPKDVEILSRRGIIDNWLGVNEFLFFED